MHKLLAIFIGIIISYTGFASVLRDTIVTPLKYLGDTAIAMPGKLVIINKDGFPKQLKTFYNKEITRIQDSANILLFEPIHFHFTRTSNGKDIQLQAGKLRFTDRSPGHAAWTCTSQSDSLEMQVNAGLENDGYLVYSVRVTAKQELRFKDIVMHIPFLKEKVDYLEGLGSTGKRPEKVSFKWGRDGYNDGVWIGDLQAGLYYVLRDETYTRPMPLNFYKQKKISAPKSWDNDGKGGIEIAIKGSSMLANNFSGERGMEKGSSLYYCFVLQLTPIATQ